MLLRRGAARGVLARRDACRQTREGGLDRSAGGETDGDDDDDETEPEEEADAAMASRELKICACSFSLPSLSLMIGQFDRPIESRYTQRA